jgi:hypothetical protein
VHLANASTCTDGDACTTADSCVNKACAPGPAAVCDDGNVCTDDSCDKTAGCVNLANASTCTDGDACTTADSCVNKACAPGPAAVCDDGNVCTDDSCDKTAGCAHAPNASLCNDGNSCTVGDQCAGSTCLPGAVTNCDDGNACTDDSCDPTLGCAQLANTATCTDGDACTVNDTCAATLCKGVTMLCDDANACTDDTCVAGACTAQAKADCTSCLSETFPSSPLFAGTATTTSAQTVAWALQSSASVSAPYALSASWLADAATASATWTLPGITATGPVTIELWVDAQLGDPACGSDDLEVRVGDTLVQTVCESTVGPTRLSIPVPEALLSSPVVINLVAVAGAGGGKIVVDNLSLGGTCTPLACDTCATGTSCNAGTGACEYHVVLSELAAQGPASADDEFVELYNPGNTPATLTGVLLQYRSSTNVTTWTNKITGGLPEATIAPHGYYLIGGKSYVGTVTPDLQLTVDLAFSASAGTVQLTVPAAAMPLDLLGYGTTATFESKAAATASAVATGSLERKASVGSTVASMTAGTDALAGNGFDSEVNAADWLIRNVRQPQNKTSLTEP